MNSMSYAERKIVEMLWAASFDCPILMEYIRKINAGHHLDPRLAEAPVPTVVEHRAKRLAELEAKLTAAVAA
jgi:hypothetical protein